MNIQSKDSSRTNYKWIGKNTRRPDGVDKVTGRARYGDDMVLPGMLYAKILRSPHAHAKILSIDVSKAQALKVLRARLYEKELEAQQSATAEKRRGMVGSGDRSERIRTYNFPQGRLTDHRINLTLYKLEDIMLGKLEQVIDPLLSHHQAELLKAS